MYRLNICSSTCSRWTKQNIGCRFICTSHNLLYCLALLGVLLQLLIKQAKMAKVNEHNNMSEIWHTGHQAHLSWWTKKMNFLDHYSKNKQKNKKTVMLLQKCQQISVWQRGEGDNVTSLFNIKMIMTILKKQRINNILASTPYIRIFWEKKNVVTRLW